MLERLFVAALSFEKARQATMGFGLAGVVAQPAIEAESVGEMRKRFVAESQSEARAAQPTVRLGLTVEIRHILRSRQGRALGLAPLLPVTAPIEVLGERRGELPGIGLEAGGGA